MNTRSLIVALVMAKFFEKSIDFFLYASTRALDNIYHGDIVWTGAMITMIVGACVFPFMAFQALHD